MTDHPSTLPFTASANAARHRSICWAILILASVLRLGWIGYYYAQHGAELPYDDEVLHWSLATNLVQHGSLVTDDGRYAARMPVYPLLLATCAPFGDTAGIVLARVVQALLGTLTVLVALRWAQAAGGVRAGVVAGLLVACDPFQVFFANLLLTETLFTLLLLLAAAATWRLITVSVLDWRALLTLALTGALAILTRPSVALLIPVLWLLVFWNLAVAPRRAAAILICPGVLLLLLLPWGLRNQAVLGAPAWLSSNGGVTLYDAQGPQADGSSNQAFLQEMLQVAPFKALNEVQRDAFLRRLAVDEMRHNPGRVMTLAVRKVARLWSPVPNVAEYRGGAAAWAGAAYTLVVGLGALGSLMLALRRGTLTRRRTHVIIWTGIVYFTLLHAVYVGSVRYRVPLMPLLAVAAATGVGMTLRTGSAADVGGTVRPGRA